MRKIWLQFLGTLKEWKNKWKKQKKQEWKKQIFEFSENRNKARSETVKWISAIVEDIHVARITQTEITFREIYKYHIFIGNLVRR